MDNCTQEENEYLSYLLDDVTGTEEMIKIRQDYCEMHDWLRSCPPDGVTRYFTGSRAEGLDLEGSDNDFMHDINDVFDIEVSESEHNLAQSARKNKLLIVTDNVPPAFVMLKCDSLQNPILTESVVNMQGHKYLSSHLFLQSSLELNTVTETETSKITGPSIESWTEYCDTSESGRDDVHSILCKFWPTSAAEWRDRPRKYGWPSQSDKEYIEAFGFHLVAVGHPLSENNLKSLEWRLSFSIAERTLVWSFNHTQLQCYAVMKLILKQFIKPNCIEKHASVLCSYFIKTFLFWQFETTPISFWQMNNLTSCIMYLFYMFKNCIEIGELPHYFVSRFNLFEIKLTSDAQRELLHIFGKITECGIPILGQCASLSGVWSMFCEAENRMRSPMTRTERLVRHILDREKLLMENLNYQIFDLLSFVHGRSCSYEELLCSLINLTNEKSFSRSFSAFVIRRLCFLIVRDTLFNGFNGGNKFAYSYMKSLENNVYGTDLSTSKLWLATFLLQQGDFCRSQQTVNDVLSSIPHCALYYSVNIKSNHHAKQLYQGKYSTHNPDTICRAQEAWLNDMNFTREEYPLLPRAIQVELDYSDPKMGAHISPYTYAKFLMFLCYHGLGNHYRSLLAVIEMLDTVLDDERCSTLTHHAYNIIGHCLLMLGDVKNARSSFVTSAGMSLRQRDSCAALDKYNAAHIYLSYMVPNL